ncbi:MAG: hypothetical protein IJ228_12450 [Succinivibrio sp.]|nr:hypothetical protein [Succinivibrio sp.]
MTLISEAFKHSIDEVLANWDVEEAERVRRSYERAWEKRVLEKGFKQGLERGFKQGFEQGFEKGREEEKIRGVLKLHDMNMSKEFIAEFAGYSLKKVDEIIADAQKIATATANDAAPDQEG